MAFRAHMVDGNLIIDGTITADKLNISGSVFVGVSLESDNYVAGVSGFKLDAVTGSAELQDVTARGQLSTGSSGAYIVVGPAGEPYKIEMLSFTGGTNVIQATGSSGAQFITLKNDAGTRGEVNAFDSSTLGYGGGVSLLAWNGFSLSASAYLTSFGFWADEDIASGSGRYYFGGTPTGKSNDYIDFDDTTNLFKTNTDGTSGGGSFETEHMYAARHYFGNYGASDYVYYLGGGQFRWVVGGSSRIDMWGGTTGAYFGYAGFGLSSLAVRQLANGTTVWSTGTTSTRHYFRCAGAEMVQFYITSSIRQYEVPNATNRWIETGSGQMDMRFYNVPALSGNTAIINTTSWQLGYLTSRRMHKRNVRQLDPADALSMVRRFKPSTFEYRLDLVPTAREGVHLGAIAEDVAEVHPALAVWGNPEVSESPDRETKHGIDPEVPQIPTGLETNALAVLGIAGVKALDAQLRDLAAEVRRLRAELVELQGETPGRGGARGRRR